MRFRVLIVAMVMLFPGCLEDLQEETTEQVDTGTVVDGGYSNISMNIFLGESPENATANYTVRIMLNHSAAPLHADNMEKHVRAGNYNMTHFHRIIDGA